MDSKPKSTQLEYLDFDLEIGLGDGRTYPVAVLDSPSGETHGVMQWPYDEVNLRLRLVELENVLLRSATTHRAASTEDEQTVAAFGTALFNALFDDEVRNRYEVSLERARMQGKGLRIKLRITAPELAALPWEFLYDQNRAEYLCFSRQTPIVRYPALPVPIQPMEITPPLRILGMVASPRGLPELDVQTEKARLSQPLEGLQEAGLVELHWLEGETWRDLQRALRQGPWHVFHFIGHGGFDTQRDEGFFALCDESGGRFDIRATQLARLIADHTSLRLVVLNACEGARSSQDDVFSSSASILLRGGVPAVLAMQYAITDRAALEFARTFYEALADGVPVDTAVAEGRLAISMAFADTIEWGTPVLYLRAEDGVLFNLPAGQRRQLNPLREPAAPSHTAQPAQQIVETVQPQTVSAEPAVQPLPLLQRLSTFTWKQWAAIALGLPILCLLLWSGSGVFPYLAQLFPSPTPNSSSTPPAVAAMLQPEPTHTPTQVQALELTDTPVVPTGSPTPTLLEPSATPTSTPPAAFPSSTPTNLAAQELQAGATQIATPDGMAQVYIPMGSFEMGCDKDNDADLECFGPRDLLHTVFLDAYWIDQTNITNAMYDLCVQDGVCDLPLSPTSLNRDNYYSNPEYSNHPVINITWEQAETYCTWAGRRLPSEAEWEKAARGDEDTRVFPWGNNPPDCKIANFDPGTDCVGDTSAVDQYPLGASPYGVLDMAGNVWDWVNDYWDENYYSDPLAKINPSGPDPSGYRVMRGGCFINAPYSLRVAFRAPRDPTQKGWDIGFRCAASLDPTP